MAPQTIAGRYQVERPIGRGGMGTVWLARDERLGRSVAIKQIGLMPGETAPDVARAMREARISALLNHPHVVSVYDVVEEDDHIWLVMEYVACRTLWQIVSEDGPLSPEVAVGIGAQVADGLAAAHAVDAVHRDVKPGNVLVTAEGLAKISDFGIARAPDEAQLTRTGIVVGTPEYFAPEVARGEEPTPAADVWALGATLYAAVEGAPPYPQHRNTLALLATIASQPPPRPEHAGFLTAPIQRMLDPDPASRWSMVDVAHVLKGLEEQHARDHTLASTSAFASEPADDTGPAAPAAPTPTVASEPAGRIAAAAQPERRRRRPIAGRLLVVGLVGLLALVAVGGLLLLRDGSPGRSAATSSHGSSPSASPKPSPTSSGPGESGSPSPSSATSPTASSGGSASTTPRGATGARQFVGDYYALLPADTRSAWSALSPSFQDQVGGYDSYQGFWSTISSVSVDRMKAAGARAVDVSLTYTKDDGGEESEVRRIFVERDGSGYVITGDDVVG